MDSTDQNQSNSNGGGSGDGGDNDQSRAGAGSGTKVSRRRAARACLSCRARKVRCDVTTRGRPCMNCYLDSEPCVVTGRADKYRHLHHSIRDDVATAVPPYSADKPVGSTAPCATHDHITNPIPSYGQPAPKAPSSDPGYAHRNMGPTHPAVDTFEAPAEPRMANTYYPLQDEIPTMQPSWSNKPQPLMSSAEISYGYFPFLSIPTAGSIPPQDFNFLESQGCLRVPTRPLLDDFIQKYFLYVHPVLPLIDEGDFWDMYYGNGASGNTMSLCLFHAMLFASSTFVSEETCQALGHPDIRSTRAMFLRRAKLLYDMGPDPSPLSVAQAALLLSYTSFSSTKTPNMLWLTVAIENAKLADAHLYNELGDSRTPKELSILKKVWWCCIIRDRTIGLFMRRPIYITHEQFDFSTPCLTAADFEHEFGRSRVYDRATKKQLAEVLAHLVNLYIILTDISQLAFSGGSQRHAKQKQDHDRQLMRDCKAALKQWYATAQTTFPKLQSASHHGKSSSSGEGPHDSVILFLTYMYMYYHTTRIVVCHYEVLALDLLQGDTQLDPATSKDLPVLFENRHILQDALSSVTRCHKDLVKRGLIQWLPISAIGCLILPLILTIFDAKLTSSPKRPAKPSARDRHHHLNTLTAAMRTYASKYDGMDWANEIIGHAVALPASEDSQADEVNPNIDWMDLFAFRPQYYFRITLVVDVGLSKGRIARNCDLPAGIQRWAVMGGGIVRQPQPSAGPALYLERIPVQEKSLIEEKQRVTEVEPSRSTPKQIEMVPRTHSVAEAAYPHNSTQLILGLDEYLLGSMDMMAWMDPESGLSSLGTGEYFDGSPSSSAGSSSSAALFQDFNMNGGPRRLSLESSDHVRNDAVEGFAGFERAEVYMDTIMEGNGPVL